MTPRWHRWGSADGLSDHYESDDSVPKVRPALGEFCRSSRRILSAISANYVVHLGANSCAHPPSRARWPTRTRTADRPTSRSVHVASRLLAPTAARAATQRQRHVALAAWAVAWARRSAVRSPMGSRRSEGGRTRSSRSACSCIKASQPISPLTIN